MSNNDHHHFYFMYSLKDKLSRFPFDEMRSRIFGKIIVLPFLLIFPQLAACAQENDDALFAQMRKDIVHEQIIARGIKEEKVIAAFRKVERHKFVPENLQRSAYEDHPLPIGYEQTISQPYIVALMTELARLKPEDRVLEIGTGSGYQAAILAEIAKQVYTIEILKPLAESSRKKLKDLGYKNIQVKWGDGYLGWEEFAPFDVIIVTAAPDEVPRALVEQLKIGGRLVIPVGESFQELKLITKTKDGIKEKSIIPVRFVPMIKSK